MKIYEPKPGMYVYTYLPAFAKFMLDQNLQNFVKDQVKLSKELNLPLLKFLTHLSGEQLEDFLTRISTEYLHFLADNKAKEYMEAAFSRWLKDQLEVIGKFEISAEDITVLNYVRGKLLKKWVHVYDLPTENKFILIEEIDNLIFGANTSAFNNFIDIVKEKLERESHFNKQLVETSPGIIFIFDLIDQKDVYINGNVQEIMGFSQEEVLAMKGNLMTLLAHPDDINVIEKGIEAIFADGRKTHVLEYRFRHKHGDYRWLSSYVRVFKWDDSGKPVEVLGVCFEVTKTKQTAEALKKREEQLLEAQAIAKIGSFEWDLATNTSVNSPELINILEINEKDRDIHFMQRVHPDDRQRVEQSLEAAYKTGLYDCQYRYLVNNKEKYLWARGVVIFTEERPVLMRGTVQDITELKTVESALMGKTEELKRSNEGLQQFASIACHDLKEPLRKMSMYSDLVLTFEESISESSKVNLEKVKSSSIRMQKMIDEILDFSALSNAALKENTNLQEVVDEALEMLQDRIMEKKAVIKCDKLPNAVVIPSQMRQLFQNLIANALKFSKPDVPPIIAISCSSYCQAENGFGLNSRYIEIRIRDNGIGFKQEYAERIFGLFTRLHNRTTYDGTGLGLSICKRIVENHKGTIRAESEPGQGATFIITLPA